MKFLLFSHIAGQVRSISYSKTQKKLLSWEASQTCISISKPDELVLKEILKDKTYVDRLIGFYFDDNVHAPVMIGDRGQYEGGNLGIVLEQQPAGKHPFRYMLRGYTVPVEMLADLFSAADGYKQDALLGIAKYLAVSNKLLPRAIEIPSMLNAKLEIHLGDIADPIQSKFTFVVNEDATEKDVLALDITEEKRNRSKIKFKPIEFPSGSGEYPLGIKRCKLTFFKSLTGDADAQVPHTVTSDAAVSSLANPAQ